MNRQERFSLRKYKFGVASVLLGAVLVLLPFRILRTRANLLCLATTGCDGMD